jgi:predicted Zn-dependent protease
MAAVLAVALAGCSEAPITERNQLIVVSDEQMDELGSQAFRQLKSQADISDDRRLTERVERIGRRIAEVSAEPDADWEFVVIDNEAPNAFAMPGGNVGVHTGLFDVARNDAQLAAVMAHEIAHAVARHHAERVSQEVIQKGGLQVLGFATESEAIVQLASAAAQLGITLPYSRTQEAEADRIGLIYMARAGYDPRAAVELWQNFSEAGGARPPEFLSTHPSPGSRIERLKEYMPEALEIYRQQS